MGIANIVKNTKTIIVPVVGFLGFLVLTVAAILVSDIIPNKGHNPGGDLPYWLNPVEANFISGGWDFKLGHTVEEIKMSLGKPLSETIKGESYPGEFGEYDREFMLVYDGLTVTVYRAEGPEPPEPYEVLHSLAITKTKFPVKWSLGIGAREKEVKSILGNPYLVEKGRYDYCNNVGDTASFFFKDGVVSKVQWVWTIADPD